MALHVDRRTVLGGALSLSAGSAARAQVSRPNIVFIMADDLGYGDVGCYGRLDIRTPHIDGIAARGVRFLQGYANSAVCSATRTGLITGRYQYRLPVGLEEPISLGRDVGLPPEHPTLPSLLKAAGYGTALVGKWHLGKLPKFGPLLSGYDHFWGYRGGAVDYYRHFGTDGREDLWDGDTPVHQAGYMTELLGDRAVAQVDEFAKAGAPFLLSLHFSAPHWPWEAPGDTAESERMTGPTLRHFDGGSRATYRRMVEAMDAQIGRVLATVEARGLLRDTIVVFTSDNGGERFSDTRPFTGIKTELLEGGLRIPAIVSWPARLPQGVTTEQVGISMDWMPTLLAAAGTVPNPAFPPDGVNLLPVLSGLAPVQERSLFWRYKAHAQRAARVGDYKFLKLRQNTFLFDVVADPLERANLKGRMPGLYADIEAAWLRWNATMLPEINASFTEGYTGAQLADHFGVDAVPTAADEP